MKHVVKTFSALALLAALAALAWWQWRPVTPDLLPLSPLPGDEAIVPATSQQAAPPGDVLTPPIAMEPATAAPAATPDAPLVPSADHPIETPAPALPLPPLAESDPEIIAALSEAMDAGLLRRFFDLDTLARRFVICVDLLPSGKLPLQNRLAHRVEGRFTVIEQAEGSLLDPANYARYAPLVQFVTAQDPATLARVYRRFYPLLQQSYEEIGYSGRYFNDRLIAVIDHLLAVEPPTEPVALVQPKVFFRYADPSVEAASAGHRILYRIGPEHRARVLQWLAAMRTELARALTGPVSPSPVP